MTAKKFTKTGKNFKREGGKNLLACQNIYPCGKVRKKLSELKPEPAPGPDKIRVRFLKEHAEEIQPALACIFNKSMKEGMLQTRELLASPWPAFRAGLWSYVSGTTLWII